MSKKIKLLVFSGILLIVTLILFFLLKRGNPNPEFTIGQALDSLNHVKIYYNGSVSHTGKRNVSPDGYNIGLTYQCVEFVKRYYYEYYHHKMPDSYGNAKDFFDSSVKDGQVNPRRDLIQFTNPSRYKPAIGDMVIFDGHAGNSYGHVAIISDVTARTIEIIQQNPGPFASSRVRFDMDSTATGFTIQHERLIGRLRMKKQNP